MAQKFCSFCCCCCSCCTLPSPSPSPQSSPQHQRQPISSPPRHHTITAHSSSSPQHPTPPMADFKIYLQKYSDIYQIYTLIPLLEELLKIASGERSEGGVSTCAVRHSFKDGQRMLDMIDKRIGKRPLKKNSEDGTVEEIGKVFIELLKGSEKIPTVGVALCMLGSVLERFSNVRDNRKECLYVLERIVDLGKQIMKLNELIPNEKKKLDDGVGCIVEGSIMCISQLGGTTIPSFFTATLKKENLSAFHRKVDRFYANIQLSTEIGTGERVIDMGERVIGIADKLPEIVPESQELYGYQPTVGIEGAKERVIELLDLNAQDARPVVVVVHGFGGIGKTTLADAVYNQLNLQFYKYCRIHMEQGCTKNELKGLQEKILYGLFSENIKLKDCNEGQGLLQSFFKKYSADPLFLYIDNALKYTDLEQFLPKRLDICLPPKSRILITTRNLKETDIFVGRNIVRRAYDVNPLPDVEARKLLLEKVCDYDDEDNIVKLLKLCGGVPLLLELAGSQLDIHKKNRKIIALEMLNEGKNVRERDISDRMVGFVYDRLLPPVREAFLDIASFFYDRSSKIVSSIVGEEEFRALESASFVKTSKKGGVIVHDIVRARGKILSEGNRLTNVNTLLECLNDDEKLKQLRGIYFVQYEKYDQPAIEINCHHLNCMRHSLSVLQFNESQITFSEKYQKPFEQLRYLMIGGDVPDLPMELEKLEHLVFYGGPFAQGMNLYEFPPSLRFMSVTNYSQNRVAYSKVPPKVTQPSSLVQLTLYHFNNIQRLPDGVEMLTELEKFTLFCCRELRELPCKFTELSNLKNFALHVCNELKELPSNFGQLQNLENLALINCFKLVKLPSDFSQLKKLKTLDLSNCSKLVGLPTDFGQLQNLEDIDLENCFEIEELPSNFSQLKNLKYLCLSYCSRLVELPSDFGQLQNLENLTLIYCSRLVKLPSDFSQLKKLKTLDLSYCSKLVELPSDFGQLQDLENLYLKNCSQLEELPCDFSQLKNLKELNLTNCYTLEKWPSSFGDLTQMRVIYLSEGLLKLEDSFPKDMKGIIVR